MKQCEKCGHQITEGAAFCTNCGAAINTPQQSASSATTSAFINMNSNSQTAGPTASMSATPFSSQPADSIPSSQASSSGAPKKKVDGKVIAMAAVSIICLAVGIVGVVLALNGNKNNTSGGEVAVNNPTTGGSTVDVVSSGTKVSYAGYEFIIPDGYEYELSKEGDAESLLVSNSPDDYAAEINYLDDITFASLESNVDAISAIFTEQYGNPVTGNTKTIDDKEYIYFDLGEFEGANAVFVISKADLYYFETIIVTNAGVSGTNYLENVANVLGTAQKKKTMSRSLQDSGIPTTINLPDLSILLENS